MTGGRGASCDGRAALCAADRHRSLGRRVGRAAWVGGSAPLRPPRPSPLTLPGPCRRHPPPRAPRVHLGPSRCSARGPPGRRGRQRRCGGALPEARVRLHRRARSFLARRCPARTSDDAESLTAAAGAGCARRGRTPGGRAVWSGAGGWVAGWPGVGVGCPGRSGVGERSVEGSGAGAVAEVVVAVRASPEPGGLAGGSEGPAGGGVAVGLEAVVDRSRCGGHRNYRVSSPRAKGTEYGIDPSELH
jgi:hypothetical protein